MRFFGKLVVATAPLIMLLNYFGWIVGGIWLLFTGHWAFAVGAFLVGVFFPYAYSLFCLILIPFTLLLTKLEEKRQKGLLTAVGIVTILLSHFINLVYVVSVFLAFMSYSESNTLNYIPFMIFGWSVATGPFSHMASKERGDSVGTFIGLYIVYISYLILCATYILKAGFLVLPLIALVIILSLIVQIKVVREAV
jgi:hypothetical protein